jgi:hypothetical protein
MYDKFKEAMQRLKKSTKVSHKKFDINKIILYYCTIIL